jgi:type I restriction enzyme M protein
MNETALVQKVWNYAHVLRRYSPVLDKLARRSGIVGTIFLEAQNEIQDPAKLRRLVGLIDGETWLGLGVDVKGSIYEGLLKRNA